MNVPAKGLALAALLTVGLAAQEPPAMPPKGRTGLPAEIRARIRGIKQKDADGLTIIGMDRDQLEAIMDEAHTLGMRTATHIAVEETTAKD